MKKVKLSRFGKKNKKNILIIFLLLIIIMLLSIGYSIFTERLIIKGTVAGTSHFKVYFIEAWVDDETKGTAIINKPEGANKVTYNVTLLYPGDKCLVGTKIKNESSVKVRLKDFAVSAINPSSDIKFDYIPLNTETEILDVEGICDYEFTIEWDKDSNNTNPGPVSFEITLEYEQYTEDIEKKPSHDHGEGNLYTIHFNPNGGVMLQKSKQIIQGAKYGALPTPQKTEYTFVGWYTDLENGNRITAEDIFDMENDITLYAMWNWDGHSYGPYEITTQASCTEPGEEEALCSVCGDTITRSVEELGHNYSEYVTTTAAKCLTSGSKIRTCQRSGCSHSETETIAALGHSWSSWTTTTAATCQATGSQKRTCQRSGCGVSQTGTLSKVDHSYVSGWCYSHNGGQGSAVCKWCGRCVACGSTNTKKY